MMTEEEAWAYFWESVDDLRTLLGRRDLVFTVDWKMVAKRRPKKKRSAAQRVSKL